MTSVYCPYILNSIQILIDAKATGISRAERTRIQREIYNNVVGLPVAELAEMLLTHQLIRLRGPE